MRIPLPSRPAIDGRRRNVRRWSALALCAAAGACFAQPPYEVVRVDGDLPEGSEYFGNAIGPDGHVVGTYIEPTDEYTFGFRWRDGDVVELPSFAGGSTPSPGLQVIPKAVNATGVVVGDLRFDGFPNEAFWYSAPTFVSGAFRWTPPDLRAVNGLSENGRVVGSAVFTEGPLVATQAVAWTLPSTTDGIATDVRQLGRFVGDGILESQAIGVSPSGEYVVGQARRSVGAPAGARWNLSTGVTSPEMFMPPSAAVSSELVDVNDQGFAAGTFRNPTRSGIYIVGRTAAEVFEFPGLGGSSAAAAAIDAAGNIVGFAADAQEISRAVITDGDVLVDLRTRLLHRWRNYTMSEATDINDRGEILVQACCGTSCGVAVLRPALHSNDFETDSGCGP
ncbi:MAG: hypothetical protein ACK59M_04710 [Pseudomonadota bacterium]|jgi:hypothetical protein